MVDFLPTNKHTKFLIDKKVNISKLDEEIRTGLAAQRWENDPEKKGFSGISTTEFINPDGSITTEVIVHWTRDGINGFNIEFPPNLKVKIANVLNNHKPV